MAVLYRNHSHSLELQVELTRRNIPYRVRSGLRFFEQRHIKDVLAHLRFVDNPRDEVAFVTHGQAAAGLRAPPGGPALAASSQGARTRCAAFASLEPRAARSARAGRRPRSQELQSCSLPLASEPLSGQPGEAVRHVVDGLLPDRGPATTSRTASSRLEDLEQLALFADGYPDLDAFLAEVSLLNELSGEDAGRRTDRRGAHPVHRPPGQGAGVARGVRHLARRGALPHRPRRGRGGGAAPVLRRRHPGPGRLFLVHPVMARDRYRVDVLLSPSRFLTELPDDVVETLNVTPEPAPEPVEALPAGLYRLPGFVGDDS